MHRAVAVFAILLPCWLPCGTPAQAADEKPIVAVSPKDAGPDFPFQGEYAGTIRSDDGDVKLGIQVIARGNGKFEAVAYPGGLPGDGWNGNDNFTGKGERKEKRVLLHGENGDGVIEGGKLTVVSTSGETLGTLKKVLRKSPTLGAKPLEGAVVLFDGTSAAAFEKGRMTDDGLLIQGTRSKQKFQAFRLHLEFMLSFMPSATGQGRSNSGCYMQGRYETQILDSFGLSGEHNECGGIYTVKKPDVNMCFPPLSWQTYDVEFTPAKFDSDGKKTANARMSVRHNGVLIQDNVEVDHATTAAPLKEGPTPGPIYLQNHGNPVRFRNIWVVPES